MSAEKQKTLLLVEDEAIIAMAQKLTLEKYGYRVLAVHSGEEAVTTVAGTPGIDLILMDIDLGAGMDGTEAAAIILKDHDLPVVFLSSHMEPEIVAKTEKITSYGYVVKDSSGTVLDTSIKMAFKLFEANSSEKKKELALSQSNDLLSKLARLVPGVIFQFRLDPDGRSAFPYASPGMNDINELTPEEVREDATHVFARLHPDDYDHVVGAIQASALTLNTFYCEFRVMLPRQGLRWHLSQAHPERLADGGTLWHGIISDITERKLAEEALRASQQLIEGIINTISVRVFWKDVNLVYLGCNSAFARDAGFADPKDIVGKDDYQMTWRDQADLYRRDDRQVIESGRAKLLIEEPQTTPEGLTIHLMTSKMPLRNAKGEIVGVLGTYMDITERKQDEQALLENTSRLELAMQAADMAWWEMDLSGGHVTFAKRKAEMLGYPAEKFKHYQDFVTLIHADDREKAMAAMRGHLDGSLPRYEVDYRIAASSGEYIWFHDVGSIGKRDASNKPLNVTGLVINITERKRAEEEIQRQLAEKEVLLQEVHHRIKNNIASIGGILSLKLRSTTHPEAIAVLQDTSARVDSMRVLYEKLLVSKDYQDVSVKKYVESLADAIVALFPDQAKVRLDQQFVDFHLDPKRLFTLGIIINELLTNVMKYAFAGKKSGQIRLSLAKEGRRVTLTLQDNGVGIADGFDLEKSNGFGLTLVKMLSQELGGSFTIEKHKGTRCTVSFDV